MITSLRLRNFKNFADETLRVGPFTLIVGANASGKSNIRDAFRFLHGIGREYPLAEIVGGRDGAGGSSEWRALRGAGNEIARFGCAEFALEVSIKRGFPVYPQMGEPSDSPEEPKLGPERDVDFFIQVRRDPGSGRFSVVDERVSIDSRTLYSLADIDNQHIDSANVGLTQFPYVATNPEFRGLSWIYLRTLLDWLRSIRFLDLQPDGMRLSGFPGRTVLGDAGENLPTVLEDICADAERKETLTAWLRALTPMDVRDLGFRRDERSRVDFFLIESDGREVSADSASDGTLRFLGILAALLGTAPAPLYVFEDIDHGLHPARLHLLVELIERQTAERGIQIVATTHSPGLLSMIDERTFKAASVVWRGEDTRDAVLRPLSGLPNAARLRTSQGLGRLLEGGWVEDALAFTEGYESDGNAAE